MFYIVELILQLAKFSSNMHANLRLVHAKVKSTWVQKALRSLIHGIATVTYQETHVITL